MKKNIIYIGVSIIIGMLIGYFLFGNTSGKIATEDPRHTDEVADQGWTCSMHPQILLHEAGDCPICGMDLTPSDTGTNHLTTDQFRMTENAIALANIQTSIVGKTDFNSEGLKLSGKIKENEKANSVQVTHFSGRIEKLLVNSVGEEVYKGQPIAILYSPELVATQQELLTAATLKKEQPELYEAVRNKLKLRKLSDNQIDQIESSGKIQETFPIYAHVSGVISQKMVEEGNHIVRGQILFKIMNLSTVWATFDAYENQISQLKKGQRIKIKTNAYPNKDFDATITFIDPVLNTKTRTIPVRVVLQNEDAIFKPGMFVEGIVSAAGSIPESKITVPKSSVLWTGERSIVYIKAVSDQPVFEMREVTLGTTEGDA